MLFVLKYYRIYYDIVFLGEYLCLDLVQAKKSPEPPTPATAEAVKPSAETLEALEARQAAVPLLIYNLVNYG